MQGIKIIKAEDIPKPKSSSNPFSLILRQDDLEVMCADITAKDFVWIAPADDDVTIEYYYILNGLVEVTLPDETITLGKGDSLSAQSITADVRINALEPTQLLITVNHPQYDSIDTYHTLLDEMSMAINEKDNTTLTHSRKVTRYAELIYANLPKASEYLSFDELIPAAKYHDVGKIYTPDKVLKKAGKFTPEEYESIKRHASDSSDILRPVLGERVAEIAGEHHERLDGSGYPKGLKGDEIHYGAKIIAVADSFDAMTTERSYNVKKDALAAAEELVAMSDKYDAEIAKLLCELVKSGEADPEKVTERVTVGSKGGEGNLKTDNNR